MPLTDLSGSTIAIVNAASPASPPATTYTYNPSGVPSVSGQASNYPFLYQGMEDEFTDQQADFGQGILYYRGDGQFYSAQIARSFSLTGAQSASGPGGSGGYSPAGRSLPPMFTPAGHESYWQSVESEDTSALESTVSISSGEGSGGVPVGGIIYGIESLISFFEWAFGGSAGLPPNYFVFKARLERGKRHPLYDQIDGVPTDIVLNESPAELAQGDAPSPYQYYQWAKTANWLQNLENLYEFHRGGSLDAQAYGASPAYANYVFGVYMAAHGYSLSTTLNYANDYASRFSHYPAGKPMSPTYPGTPAANIANITKGFNDERGGSFGLP